MLWRRLLHGAGGFALVYYIVPTGFFVVVSKEVAVLIALGLVGLLELLRLGFGVELPTIRGYEEGRPASYVFYAVGIVLALLLFPEAIGATVVLGTALVDPLAGELRGSSRGRRLGPWPPIVAYGVLATLTLGGIGRWPWTWAVALAVLAAGVAVGMERWRLRWLDDDLTMTVVPALALYGVGVVALGLPR